MSFSDSIEASPDLCEKAAWEALEAMEVLMPDLEGNAMLATAMKAQTCATLALAAQLRDSLTEISDHLDALRGILSD